MNNQNNEQFKYLSKLNEEQLKPVMDEFMVYSKKSSRAFLPFYVFIIVIGVYNIFFAGNSYSISDYNLIKTVFASICGVLAVILVVFAIIMFKHQKDVFKQLKILSEKLNIPYKPLKKEFRIFIKSTFGGLGI